MEGRRNLFLALGLLSAMAGCTSLGPTQTTEVRREIVATREEDPPAASSGQPAKRLGPVGLVGAGEYFVRAAAEQEKTPALQQQLYDKARKAFQQAISTDPRYSPAYQALANLYLILEDTDHAIETYQKAVELAPNQPQLWYEFGMCYCRKKDFTRGVPCLSKACDLDPENRQYANVLGYTLARIGKYDESLACFCRVHSRAKAHYNLARMLLHVKQTELAKQHLQKALQEDPNLESAQVLLTKLTTGGSGEVQPASFQEGAPEPETPAPHPAGSGQ